MTDQTDYSTWTYEDHLAKVEKLAAQADDAAATEGAPSVAARHRESILQIAARAQVHASLATLKKPAEAPKPTGRQPKASAD